MATAMKKRIPTQVGVSTTGTLLTGVEGVAVLRVSSAESTGTRVLYVELGATVDGGSLAAARAEAYLVSAIPLEVDVRHMGGIKLFGDAAFNVTVTLR